MSEMLLPFALLATFFAVGLISVAFAPSFSGRREGVRLLEKQVARTSISVREQQLSRSFGARALFPVVSLIQSITVRATPIGMRKRLAKKLSLAGSPAKWDAERVAAMKVVAGFGGSALGLAVSRVAHFAGIRQIAIAVVLGGIGYILPDAMVDAAGKKRKDAIRKSLPDTMDLLTISVEAGLGLDAALAQVARNSSGPLAFEVARMLHEMQMGVSRADAFRRLGDRTGVDELRSFVLAMIQAEVFGISISKVLRSQAKQHRVKRRQRAEHKAMQVPVKILFPLIFCILPALFIVVMGPGVIQIAREVLGIF